MGVEMLLKELHQRGVQVKVVGDRLVFKPASKVPPVLKEQLRQHKPQLIQALLQRQLQPECLYRSPDGLCLFWQQRYNADYKPRCKDLCNHKSFRCPLDCQRRSKGCVCTGNEPPTEDELFKKCIFVKGTQIIH